MDFIRFRKTIQSSNMDDAAPSSGFKTGMMKMEEQSFIWTIKNFSAICQNKSTIDAQKMYFSTGGDLPIPWEDDPKKWSVYLQESTVDGKKWVGIYFNLEEPSRSDYNWEYEFAQMEFSVWGTEDLRPDLNTGPREIVYSSTGRGLEQFISGEELTEERLDIELTFKLYLVPWRPTLSRWHCPPSVEELRSKLAYRARKEWGILLEHPIPGNDIKLISKDGKEYSVQRQILEVQSPVLKAMIKKDPLNPNSGVIQLPDISSIALKVLITFLSTGEFHPAWTETKIVVDLTTAAAKYQLEDLLKFLDETLGKVCKVENALPLFTLANELSLKNAKAELLKFINEKSSGSPEVFCKILSGVSVPGDRADVVPIFPKESR